LETLANHEERKKGKGKEEQLGIFPPYVEYFGTAGGAGVTEWNGPEEIGLIKDIQDAWISGT